MELSKSRRHSSKKSASSSGYYQFTFEPDFSDSDDDDVYSMSPREIVDRALRDTDLTKREPIDSYKSDTSIPEPDFSTEFLNESHDSLNLAGATPPSNTNGPNHDTNSEDRAETPESLYSPLDHPDSGYIEFVPSGSQSPENEIRAHRTPSDGFVDGVTTRGREDRSPGGATMTNNNNIIKPQTRSADDLRTSGLGSDNNSRQKQSNALNTLPNVVFRRFKSEFTKLDENELVYDDEASYAPEAGEAEFMPSTLDLTERKTFSGPAPTGHTMDTQPGNPYRPMAEHVPLEDENEALGDPERGLPAEADDINVPIILVDQATLSARAKARRRRLLVLIAVLCVVFAVAGLGAIVYLLVRFVGNGQEQ